MVFYRARLGQFFLVRVKMAGLFFLAAIGLTGSCQLCQVTKKQEIYSARFPKCKIISTSLYRALLVRIIPSLLQMPEGKISSVNKQMTESNPSAFILW